MDKTFLKAEVMVLTENEKALAYFFQKLSLYPEILHHTMDDTIVLIGESGYLSYVIELIERQLARRFDKTRLVLLSYQFALLGKKSIVGGNSH